MVLPVFVTAQDVALLNPGVTVDKANAMIRAVTARAVGIAPCLAGESLSEAQVETVRAIILDAVSRWGEAGSGAARTLVSGPFTYGADTRQDRRGAFLKSEFDDLQRICSDIAGASTEAFTISLGGPRLATHLSEHVMDRRLIEYQAAAARGWVAD